MLRYLALLLLVPLLDALLLVFLATQFDAVFIVALVVLTALVGMLLVRAEGRHTAGRLQRRLARGELPTDELLDGGFLLVAGAFLLTPGLVTDLLGFVLVLPPTRYLVRAGVKRWVITPYVDERFGGMGTGKVYTAGFPGGDGDAGETYDVGEDAYRFNEGTDREDDRE